MIKAVIFDLDDTLISETKYIQSGYRHIAKLLSNRFDMDEIQLYETMSKLFKSSPRNVFNRLFDTLNISYTDIEVAELVKEYRNHLPIINFFDDVLSCFSFLNENNISIGLITDGYAVAQRQKLVALNGMKYFDEIIVTDELGREYWKPHVKSFEIMREKLNLEYNEMVYVGDNPEKDFYISTVYPVKTIRINRIGVHSDKNYLDDVKENYSINSLSEIRNLF